jgi:hypothetical protein
MFFDDHKIVFDCGGKRSFGINAKVLLVKKEKRKRGDGLEGYNFVTLYH